MNSAQWDDLFRLVVDLCPAGMLAADGTGRIVLVNREIERLFGYSREELIGQPVDMLVPHRFRDAHPGYRAGFHAQPEARPMGAGRDLFGLRKDGTEVPVEIGLNPIHTRQGLLILGSVVDISARRALEDRVRDGHKMQAIGTLAGGIAHDFNNILRGIVGYAELARDASSDRPQVVSDLEQVTRAAERGQQLVQRILLFSRQREMSRASTKLDRTVTDVLQLLRASLPSTVQIRTALDPDAPAVVADDSQLHQVLMNLATNAGHAMAETGGVLEVGLDPWHADAAFLRAHPHLKPGLYARLAVTDSGRGMTDDVVAHAFEPFFTTKPMGSGTGLGLSVVLGIVQSHGGAVEIHSRPGEGTRIEVFLPAAHRAGETAHPDMVEQSPRKGHILFVDDEEPLAVLGRRQLQAAGYMVTTHTSALTALEDFRARPHAFDLMITDNTMPHMTGLALAREALRERPNLLIVMVSGLADAVDPASMREQGIATMLRKPHTGSDLVHAVRALIGR